MKQLFGYIEKVIFKNEESGFAVLLLQEPQKKEETTLVGILSHLSPGENVSCQGEWTNNPRFGLQFSVEKCQTRTPEDREGIERYLASGWIRGIGKHYARKIVSHFGEESLEILDKNPEKLYEIKGLGEKRIRRAISCWEEQREVHEVMIFLQKYHVTPTCAQKIYRKYQKATMEKIKKNPYCIAREIRGVGFKMADHLAQEMGIDHHAPERLSAGMEFSLFQLTGEGHTSLPFSLFLESSAKILEVEKSLIQTHWERQNAELQIIQRELACGGEEKQFYVWPTYLYSSECLIAQLLFSIQKEPPFFREKHSLVGGLSSQMLSSAEKTLNLQLASNQRLAVLESLSQKIHLITGGPGTGKSTITRVIVHILQKFHAKLSLVAPTGRAAKRLSEVTGESASTIHSLLKYQFTTGGFVYNRENPLHCDFLIVDEFSMVDTSLFLHLLKALRPQAHLLLIGDAHQLPSVGPGKVLRDLIESKLFSLTQLTEIFRQARNSQIILNAHRIHQGESPHLVNRRESDFFFLEEESPKQIIDTLLEVVKWRLPKTYSLDCIQDIQVLVPMRKGELGIDQFNTHLQRALNPSERGIVHFGRKFLCGDKVMQIRNDYEREVLNGDVGRILQIDEEEESLKVQFDQREVSYEGEELQDLVLAYASSVHKFQGSECPCIVMPLHTSHYLLLQRNVLYTAITRAKKLVVLIGMKKALFMAIGNHSANQRSTGLQQILRETFQEP